METTIDQLAQSILARRMGSETTEMALPALSTDDLDLTTLPARLDDETLERVKALAQSRLPESIPCSERHFTQCLRVLLAVMPKRQSDELSGELFVAAYQRKLGHYPEAAISYLADKAMEKCQWFPTIAECLEILSDWRRHDSHVERRALAQRIQRIEEDERRNEERQFRLITEDRGRFMQPDITPEDIANLSPNLIEYGLRVGALRRDEGGKVIPRRSKPSELSPDHASRS
jgi:hypothetical protein